MSKKDNQNKDTSMLISALVAGEDYEEFLAENEHYLGVDQFKIALRKLSAKKNLLPSEIIEISHLERSYGYQIINGTRKPSRDKVIQLAFGLKLTLEETNQLLKSANKQPLYAKAKRDSIIIHSILHNQPMDKVNHLLNSNDLQPLY